VFEETVWERWQKRLAAIRLPAWKWRLPWRREPNYDLYLDDDLWSDEEKDVVEPEVTPPLEPPPKAAPAPSRAPVKPTSAFTQQLSAHLRAKYPHHKERP
jgi:hypothetical protein